MTTEHTISNESAGSVAGNLTEIATLMNTLRQNAKDDVIIEALTQKAGWLADQCLEELGEAVVCGTFAEWSRLD